MYIIGEILEYPELTFDVNGSFICTLKLLSNNIPKTFKAYGDIAKKIIEHSLIWKTANKKIKVKVKNSEIIYFHFYGKKERIKCCGINSATTEDYIVMHVEEFDFDI